MENRHAFGSESGFVLIEMLPAAALLAVLAMVCMSALALDYHSRERILHEMRLAETLHLAQEKWRYGGDPVVVCSLGADNEWDVLTFQDEAWIPSPSAGAACIVWHKLIVEDQGVRYVQLAYRSDGMTGWKPWVQIRNWEAVTEERGVN